jgi:PEP-CTERM motif
MRKLLLGLIGASALAISSAANAVVILPGAPLTPGSDPSTSFLVSGNINSGPISATIGHTGIPLGAFTDLFQFTIPQTGTGSGSITTTVDVGDFLGVTDLDITSVVVNGLTAIETLRDIDGIICFAEGVGTCGATETFALSNVPIASGILNTITVTGTSRGLGSYGGNLTFSPAQTPGVPEPATWAMMLLGFGGIGWQFRRRRTATLPQFA